MKRTLDGELVAVITILGLGTLRRLLEEYTKPAK